MAESLLPSRFLYHFAIPCLYREPLWTAAGVGLSEAHRLPLLAELEGKKSFADVRAAWSESGLAFSVRVEGKRQSPWCHENRLEDSDGLRLWIDTRDVHNVHRAGRFCHQFVFLPSGGGRRLEEPVAEQMLINRAKENANPIRPGVLKVRREKRVDGYILEAFVPAGALTGYDTLESPRLGFNYQVYDRELGSQTLSCGDEFPFQEDPSLWVSVELVRDGKKSKS